MIDWNLYSSMDVKLIGIEIQFIPNTIIILVSFFFNLDEWIFKSTFLTKSKDDERDDNSTILCKFKGINQCEKA